MLHRGQQKKDETTMLISPDLEFSSHTEAEMSVK